MIQLKILKQVVWIDLIYLKSEEKLFLKNMSIEKLQHFFIRINSGSKQLKQPCLELKMFEESLV